MLASAGDPAGALPPLRAALGMLERALPAGDEEIAACRFEIGGALRASGDPAGALEAYADARRIYEATGTLETPGGASAPGPR